MEIFSVVFIKFLFWITFLFKKNWASLNFRARGEFSPLASRLTRMSLSVTVRAGHRLGRYFLTFSTLRTTRRTINKSRTTANVFHSSLAYKVGSNLKKKNNKINKQIFVVHQWSAGRWLGNCSVGGIRVRRLMNTVEKYFKTNVKRKNRYEQTFFQNRDTSGFVEREL